MSFWEGLKRMAKGEPVFQEEPDGSHHGAKQEDHFAKEPHPVDQDPLHTPLDKHGQKIIPVFHIDDVKPHVSGKNMEVWVRVHNTSTVALMLDRIHAFGSKIDFYHHLEPGASKQICIYKGQSLKSQDHEHADVIYKAVVTGDYFQARYIVECEYKAHDDIFVPHQLDLIEPVKDI